MPFCEEISADVLNVTTDRSAERFSLMPIIINLNLKLDCFSNSVAPAIPNVWSSKLEKGLKG